MEETPATVRLRDWFHHHWQVQATCQQCGRVATVHRGELLRRYGDEARLTQDKLDDIASRIVCIRCKARGPKLEVVDDRG